MSTDNATRRYPFPTAPAEGDEHYTCTRPGCDGILRYSEMVEHVRWITHDPADGATVVSLDDEIMWELSEDEHAYCRTCLAEYDLPEGFEYS